MSNKLENKELIDEFYNEVLSEHPDLTLKEVKQIVFTPWQFTKKEMESGELNEIRLKYFGTFKVYEGRARYMLVNLKHRFKFHKIDSKQYFKLKEMIEKFLKKNEK